MLKENNIDFSKSTQKKKKRKKEVQGCSLENFLDVDPQSHGNLRNIY